MNVRNLDSIAAFFIYEQSMAYSLETLIQKALLRSTYFRSLSFRVFFKLKEWSGSDICKVKQFVSLLFIPVRKNDIFKTRPTKLETRKFICTNPTRTIDISSINKTTEMRHGASKPDQTEQTV